MIVFYSIVEKPLAHKKIQSSLQSDSHRQEFHLELTQSYVSLLGPFIAAGPKTVRLYNINGENIKRKEWTEEIRNEAISLKDSVPFQIGLFRNAIILIVIVGALALIMPGINKKNADMAQANATQITTRLANIKAGDILRVSFFAAAENATVSTIGLAKITRADGDNIYFVRSTKTVENNFDNNTANLNINEFSATEEIAQKANLDKYRVLVAPATPEGTAGKSLGSILKFEN